MDFGEFLQMLYKYRQNGESRAEFVRVITDACIPEEAYEEKRIEVNPVYGYQSRMLQLIFNGEHPIGSDKASVLLGVLDRQQFETYFDSFPYDALEGLKQDLFDHGFDVDHANVAKACSSILDQCVRQMAAGIREVKVERLDFEAREQGRSVRNIDPASISFKDGKLYVHGETIMIDMSLMTEQEADETLRYVAALCEAYADALGRDAVSPDEIEQLPKRFRDNYAEQNKAYFLADSIRHRVRETFPADGADEFENLKADMWAGVSSTYQMSYKDAFERLLHVLEKSTLISLSSVLVQIRNLINNYARKGICHILVNDGVIPSWVQGDE